MQQDGGNQPGATYQVRCVTGIWEERFVSCGSVQSVLDLLAGLDNGGMEVTVEEIGPNGEVTGEGPGREFRETFARQKTPYRIIDEDLGPEGLPDRDVPDARAAMNYLGWVAMAPHLDDPLKTFRVVELPSGSGWPAKEFLKLMGVTVP